MAAASSDAAKHAAHSARGVLQLVCVRRSDWQRISDFAAQDLMRYCGCYTGQASVPSSNKEKNERVEFAQVCLLAASG